MGKLARVELSKTPPYYGLRYRVMLKPNKWACCEKHNAANDEESMGYVSPRVGYHLLIYCQ